MGQITRKTARLMDLSCYNMFPRSFGMVAAITRSRKCSAEAAAVSAKLAGPIAKLVFFEQLQSQQATDPSGPLAFHSAAAGFWNLVSPKAAQSSGKCPGRRKMTMRWPSQKRGLLLQRPPLQCGEAMRRRVGARPMRGWCRHEHLSLSADYPFSHISCTGFPATQL